MNAGTINVNMKDMKKFNVYSDNIRIFDQIHKNNGHIETLDVRPYVEILTDFNIFFTVTH